MTAAPDPGPAPAPRGPGLWRGYAGAAGVCVGAAVLASPLATWLDPASLVLVFILAVVLAAARFGRGPALLAAGLSVLLFNLVFVQPRFSLSVADERFLFTFLVMLIVGLIVGQLTAGLKVQAFAARRREQQMLSLYAIARDLGRALTAEQVVEIVDRFARHHFMADLTLWTFDRHGGLRALQGSPAPDLSARAGRVVAAAADRTPGAAAGGSSSGAPDKPPDAVPAGELVHPWGDPPVLPLQGTMTVRGALAVHRPGPTAWADDERQLLDTCAALVGSTLERIHYIEVARDSAVQIEGERLRNSLLSAISHDLRTPLASMVGLAESLHLTRPPPTPQQADIADAMAGTARRMSALVINLLDMARLESGAVRLDLQWQPVEEVIGSAIAAASPVLPNDRVRVRVPGDMPLVRLDAVLMERVLVNLLENAGKYTSATSLVAIEVAVAGSAFEIAMSDNGPGLPPGRHAELFRKFERGTRESTTPGVGLGLALCCAIVEAHGGTITAADAPGGGARFVIRLALGHPPSMPAPDGAQPTASDR